MVCVFSPLINLVLACTQAKGVESFSKKTPVVLHEIFQIQISSMKHL